MHPSDAQLEAYAKRTLGPAELLAVDDHLAACDTCRTQAAAPARIDEALAELRGALLPAESHLTEEQVVGLAGGARASAAVEAHLLACATCASEVEDLAAWSRRRPRVRYVTYAAAAAVLILLLIPVVQRWRPPSDTDQRPQPTIAGLDALSVEQQQRVRAALQAGIAEAPASLAGIERRSEVLMGVSPEASFRLTEPLGIVTVSDRPAFRWVPLAGAEGYTVSILDEALRPVAESLPVAEPTWTPEQPLRRGQVYAWQVAARRAKGSVTAPAPPEPIAKFRVMDEETARSLARVAQQRPDAHLVLGILHGQAGALAEAETHLAKVQPADVYFAVTQQMRARMRRAREPEGAPD